MSITDLHICEKANSSSSKTLSDCHCPPEYICVDVCPEGGFSISSIISWQHFPRSTSSRSECDDTEEESHKTISGTPTLFESVKEEEESEKPSSTEYPITKSFSQLNALHYLEVRHVFQLLNFLISHLVCNEPEDPVEFLVNLLQRCIKYRDSFGEPPHLFTNAHLKSVYSAFDPFERGHITLAQYREAMRSLGLENSITPYNQEPPLTDDECVEESNFIFEAERCLTENLKQMLRIPNLWEDNRLVWKKRMAKKKAPSVKKEKELLETHLEEEILGEARDDDSKCSNLLDFLKYPVEQEMRCEAEQLFLT